MCWCPAVFEVRSCNKSTQCAYMYAVFCFARAEKSRRKQKRRKKTMEGEPTEQEMEEVMDYMSDTEFEFRDDGPNTVRFCCR